MLEFVGKLIDLIQDKNGNPTSNVLYMHCWGGNGRTSTIATILISHLYKLPHQDALAYVLSNII